MERTEFEYEHFRGNNTKISIEDVVKRLIHINIYYTLNEDNANAFFAKNEKYMQDLYAAGKVTIQSKILMYTATLVKTFTMKIFSSFVLHLVESLFICQYYSIF